MPDLAALKQVVEKYQASTGARGVAIGPKRTDDVAVDASDRSLVFFVDEKRPRIGARRRFDDGTQIVPRRLKVGSRYRSTDVVEIGRESADEPRANVPRRRFRAGGPMSDINGEMGTFGCLVQFRGDESVYALTNRHVAVGKGHRVYFPTVFGRSALACEVTDDRDLVADERLALFLDDPQTYFDVDAAVARIPASAHERFDPDIPYLGTPEKIYQPVMSSKDAYIDRLIDTEVRSYSWNTKLRRGVISHALFARRARFNRVLLYAIVIEGRDGVLPSAERDSGKVWFDDEGAAIGLHQGSVKMSRSGSRFALATDFALLAAHWGLTLA